MAQELCDVQDLVNDSVSHSYSLSIAARTIRECRHFAMSQNSNAIGLVGAIEAIDRAYADPLIAEAIANLDDSDADDTALDEHDGDEELNGTVGF